MVANMCYGTFVFFGLICFIGAAFVYFVVPETKNLTIEEMDEVFGDEAGSAMEDRNRLERIYTELGLFDHHDEAVTLGSTPPKTEEFEQHEEKRLDVYWRVERSIWEST